jgi:cell division protein FtsN
MRLSVTAAALSLVLAGLAGAQTRASTAGDSVARFAAFTRARRLVSDGSGQSGRMLVDSLLADATPGTPAYAEALYWRASLAEKASDAERDFRQLAIEYANSPRGADALLRLAQLDLVRGDAAAAREHLTRLVRDHADAPTQARGQYWLARAALDANDAAASCTALNTAAAAATPGSDVARQIVALRGRVPRCTLRVAIGAASTPSAAPPSNPALPNTVIVDAPNDRGAERTPVTPPAAPRVAIRDSAPAVARSPVPAPRSPVVGRAFTVQVAAYPSRLGADEMATRLTKRGFEARSVAGGATPDSPPFRVRVGRWATRAEAVAALRELKGKGIAGFVAEAEPQP